MGSYDVVTEVTWQCISIPAQWVRVLESPGQTHQSSGECGWCVCVCVCVCVWGGGGGGGGVITNKCP